MKSTASKVIADWGASNAARITRTRIDLDLWDDEPEILDWFMKSDRREDRGTAVALLVGDVLQSIASPVPRALRLDAKSRAPRLFLISVSRAAGPRAQSSLLAWTRSNLQPPSWPRSASRASARSG